jgi:phage protein D
MTAAALRYAPEFRLEINGEPAPAALRHAITSVRYEDGVGAADRVEIGVANVDLRFLQKHIRGLGVRPFPTAVRLGPSKLTPGPDGLFDVDNKVSLAIGYAPGPLEEVFKGEITGVEASFAGGGVPSMTIVAHDYLNRLARGQYARGFGPLPDALIAAILSAENLLIPTIDPTIAAASTAIAAVNYVFGGTGRKQRAQSDLELLAEIAAAYDAEFWVEGDVLYLARFIPKEYASRLTLRWGESLLDFAPKMTSVGQVAAVAMKFTLREVPLSFLVTVGWDFDREAVSVSVLPGEAAAAAKVVSGPAFTIVDQPISSPADIANSALVIYHELRRKLNERVTGSASAVGDPRIRAGAVITIDDVGPDFSGDYRVSGATHSIDAGGYRTSFQVRKEILP